jgi:hypothetical protein
MFSLQSKSETFYVWQNICVSFILFQGKKVRYFLPVTSDCKADILAAADIIICSIIPQSQG